MARKIKDTPNLYGEDAKKFLKDVEKNLKKDHTEAFNRAKKVYDGSNTGWNTHSRVLLPDCDICKKHQKELGAEILSPPNEKGMCKKYHICVKCFEYIKISNNINNTFGDGDV